MLQASAPLQGLAWPMWDAVSPSYEGLAHRDLQSKVLLTVSPADSVGLTSGRLMEELFIG